MRCTKAKIIYKKIIMCDCDYNDCSTETSSSSKSFYSDSSDQYHSAPKKSVRFCGEVQIFLIPSRKDAINCASVISRCFQNMINKKPLKVRRKKVTPLKTVTFFKLVTMYPVPSRDDLKSIANDLWYEPHEILAMEQEAHQVLVDLEKMNI